MFFTGTVLVERKHTRSPFVEKLLEYHQQYLQAHDACTNATTEFSVTGPDWDSLFGSLQSSAEKARAVTAAYLKKLLTKDLADLYLDAAKQFEAVVSGRVVQRLEEIASSCRGLLRRETSRTDFAIPGESIPPEEIGERTVAFNKEVLGPRQALNFIFTTAVMVVEWEIEPDLAECAALTLALEKG